jgi:serine/threonine protein kinase
MQQTHRNALPMGYRFKEYLVQEILGHGGFGITYLATDTKLNAQVAIKEYLPNELAIRESDHTVQAKSNQDIDDFSWGLERFLQEARILAKFKHPNIVRIVRFFKANNTAYIVMEYEQGRSLSDVLKDEGTLAENKILEIISPLLDGLEVVHKAGYLHRDIKPSNIYLRDKNNSLVLLDFGAARHDIGNRSRSVTTLVTPGYAPFEQYQTKGNQQGAWTDIYAVGAVVYRAVTGTIPIESSERIIAVINGGEDPLSSTLEYTDKYSKYLLKAVDWAMQIQIDKRPQSIKDWRASLLPDNTFRPVQIAADFISTTRILKPRRTFNRLRSGMMIFITVILLMSISLSYLIYKEFFDNNENTKKPLHRTAITKYYDIASVPADDVLNMRDFPDYRSKKVGEISPYETCLNYLADTLSNNNRLWIMLEHKGIKGWVNAAYLNGNTRCKTK